MESKSCSERFRLTNYTASSKNMIIIRTAAWTTSRNLTTFKNSHIFFPDSVFIFYLTTRVIPLPVFRMKASSAAHAAFPTCRESRSARISSMFCGEYQALAQGGSRQQGKYSLLVPDTHHIQQKHVVYWISKFYKLNEPKGSDGRQLSAKKYPYVEIGKTTT